MAQNYGAKVNGSVSKPCTPVVHIKIAGKWMFIPLKMVLIGIDPYPNFSAFFNSFLMVFPLVQAVVSGTGTAAWTCQAKAKARRRQLPRPLGPAIFGMFGVPNLDLPSGYVT